VSEPPHEVLGVSPDAERDDVIEAFRRRVKETRPDIGENPSEEFKRVVEAKEAMLS
jgi:curved DNA-binding protein CbpA